MELTTPTLPALLLERAARQGDRTILRRKDHGIWRPVSWAQLARFVRGIGGALHSAGVRAGDAVAILSETRPEWAYADLAIMGLGAVSVGLPATESPARTAQALRDCNCAYVFAENEEQLDKLLAIQGECPALRRIFVFDMQGLHDFDHPMVTSLAALTEVAPVTAASAWDDAARRLDPQATAAIVYTAGTTGPAKAVRLSHSQVMARACAGAAMLGQVEADERVAFMPMSHVFERVVGLYQSLVSGTISNYVESVETVRDNFREIQPTVVGLVPRMWRRMRATIVQSASEASWVQKLLYDWALDVGARHRSGTARSPGLRLNHFLADALVLGRLRRRMGLGRARTVFATMAPMPADLLQWYRAIGVDVRLAYTITEGGGLVCVSPCAPGVLPGVALSGDGEILLSDHQATGDIGVESEAGVMVIGRRQYSLETAAGCAVPAATIETALCASPLVADALVSRDDSGHLCGVLLIDPEAMERWAHSEGVNFTGFAALMRSSKARDQVSKEVAAVNAKLPPAHRVAAIRLIERRTQPGDGELTPALTLRRTVMTDPDGIAGEVMACQVAG